MKKKNIFAILSREKHSACRLGPKRSMAPYLSMEKSVVKVNDQLRGGVTISRSTLTLQKIVNCHTRIFFSCARGSRCLGCIGVLSFLKVIPSHPCFVARSLMHLYTHHSRPHFRRLHPVRWTAPSLLYPLVSSTTCPNSPLSHMRDHWPLRMAANGSDTSWITGSICRYATAAYRCRESL